MRLLHLAVLALATLPLLAPAAPVTLAGTHVVISETGSQNTTVNWTPVPLSQKLAPAVVGPGAETGSHYLGYYTAAAVDIDPVNDRLWLSLYDGCGCTQLHQWDIHLDFIDLAGARLTALPLLYQPLKYVSAVGIFGEHSIDLVLDGSPGLTYGWINLIWGFGLEPVAAGTPIPGGAGPAAAVPEPASAALVAVALLAAYAPSRRLRGRLLSSRS